MHGPETVNDESGVCHHIRSPSSVGLRSHLQELVRRQRETRKANLQKRREAELQQRERIQENLMTVAFHAGQAAKKSNHAHSPLRRSEIPDGHIECNNRDIFDEGKGDNRFVQITCPEDSSLSSLYRYAGQLCNYSAEREQKLRELLGAEFVNTKGGNFLKGKNFPVPTPQDGDHQQCQAPHHVVDVLLSSSPIFSPLPRRASAKIPGSSDREPLAVTSVETLRPLNGIGRHEVPGANAFCRQVVPKIPLSPVGKPRGVTARDPDNNITPKSTTLLPLHDDATESSSSGGGSTASSPRQPAAAREAGRSQSSTQLRSLVDTSHHHHWVRLEAIGASEPDEEEGACLPVVDDMRPDDDQQLPVYRQSRAVNPLPKVKSFDDNLTEIEDHKSVLYSDPLRFGAVRKRLQRLASRKQDHHQQVACGDVQPSETLLRHDDQRVDSGLATAGRQARCPRKRLHCCRTGGAAWRKKKAGDAVSLLLQPADADHSGTSSSVGGRLSPPASGEHREFRLDADRSATSSTPRQRTPASGTYARVLEATSAAAARPGKASGQAPGQAQPRLTAAALGLRLAAEVNHLEALASSIQHVADMESLRQLTAAQVEAVSLAQLIKVRESTTPVKGPPAQAEVPSTATAPPVQTYLAEGQHSPGFKDVLQAAGEFNKVERRLIEKAARLSLGICDGRVTVATASSSEATEPKSISNELNSNAGCRTNHSVATGRTCSFRREHDATSSASSEADKPKSSSPSAKGPSPSYRDSLSSSSSPQPLLTGSVPTVPDEDEIGIPASDSDDMSLSTAAEVDTLTETAGLVHCVPSEQQTSGAPSQPTATPAGRRDTADGDPLEPVDPRRNAPSDSLPHASQCVSSPAGGGSTLALVKSSLLQRAAELKLRRKKAEDLLALTRKIELEEAEVVHLEREALNALQSKRHGAQEHSHKSAMPIVLSMSSSSSGKSTDGPTGETGTTTGDSPSREPTSASAVPQSSEVSAATDHPSSAASSARTGATTSKKASWKSLDRAVKECQTSTPRHLYQKRSRASPSPLTKGGQVPTANAEVQYSYNSSSSPPPTKSPLLKLEGLLGASTCPPSPEADGSTPTPPASSRRSSSSRGPRVAVRATSSSTTGRRNRVSATANRTGKQRQGTGGNGSEEELELVESGGPCRGRRRRRCSSTASEWSELESRLMSLQTSLHKQETFLSHLEESSRRLLPKVSHERLKHLESTLTQHKLLCSQIIERIKADLEACSSTLIASGRTLPVGGSRAQTDSVGTPTSLKLKQPPTADGAGREATTPVGVQTSRHSSLTTSPRDRQSTQPNTLVSLAEDFVSATDTEGDLQKLVLDDEEEAGPVAAAVSVDANREPGSALPSEAFEDQEAEDVYSTDTTLMTSSPTSSVTVNAASGVSPLPGDSTTTDCQLEHAASLGDDHPIAQLVASSEMRLLSESLTHNEPVLRHAAPASAVAGSDDKSGDIVITSLVQSLPVATAETSLGQQHRLHHAVIYTAQSATAGQPVADGREGDRHLSVADRLTHSILSDLVDAVTGDVVTIYRSKVTAGLQVATDRQLEPDREDSSAATPDVGTTSPMLTSPETNSSESSSSPSDDDDWKAEPEDMMLDGRRRNIPALVLSDGEEEDAGQGRRQPRSSDHGRSSTGSPPETLACPLFTVEHLRGMVADLPSRTSVLVWQAVHHLWQARSSAALGSREPALLQAGEEPPVQFSPDYCEDEDLDIVVQSLPGIRFVSRILIFDVIAEFVSKIYVGEDAEAEQQSSCSLTDSLTPAGGESGTAAAGHQRRQQCRLTSAQFRLWQGPTRPMTVDRLLELVREHVRKELRLRHTDTEGTADVAGSSTTLATGSAGGGFSALSRLAQWTLSRKSYVDQILELELRADEGSWLSYVPEEDRLKALLADQLWRELVDDAVTSMLAVAARAKAARRPMVAAALVVR